MAKNRILGIIGGMGPLATVNFFHKLVVMTDAEKDQTHPRILIDSNPKIPDRTLAISGTGPSPAPEIIRTAENLQRMGANFLAMPCVTAHHYYDEIQAAINIPMIHIILETADKINSDLPNQSRIPFKPVQPNTLNSTRDYHVYSVSYSSGKIFLYFNYGKSYISMIYSQHLVYTYEQSPYSYNSIYLYIPDLHSSRYNPGLC